PASSMVMDLPTIHQLTILILRPIPTSVCPLTLHTGFIAGHIYVPAGGGEDSLVPSSPTLSESFRCWVSESSYRLAFLADALLAARNCCDHFTTLTTLALKVAATAWQEWPDVVINMSEAGSQSDS